MRDRSVGTGREGQVAGDMAGSGSRRWSGWLVAGLVLLTGGVAAAEPARFGTGSKGGDYDLLGAALAADLEAAGTGLTLATETTKGSCENIRRLLDGTLDFALVQYDVAAEAYRASQAHGTEADTRLGGWMCKVSPKLAREAELRLISAVSDSAVHMLVRRPVRLADLDAIGLAPIFIGKDGSGSFETARVILGASGHPLEHLQLFTGSADEALEAMGRRELLMMMRTTSRGHADVQDVLDSGLAALNPLPEDVINRLIDGYPYYRVCPIEPKHYRGGLEYSLPTVCVSAVLLTAMPRAKVGDVRAEAAQDVAVGQLLDALGRVAADPQQDALGLEPRFRDFAEKEPIPLHHAAAQRERRANWTGALEGAAALLGLGLLLWLLRRALRRRGIATGFGFEGQLSNPLVPFAAFVLVVVCSTYVVWWLEHDSNTRLRTLNDSFWEMNTFATGNFSAEALKTSGARLIGAVATILGLGLLAWFTAALTNIFAQDQTRLWRRTHEHLVVLNFREDMLPLIRLLRSPGPTRLRSLHVVVPDALPKRVRLQLGKIKALTIHYDNPEAPENLGVLRLPRASRVIVLGGGSSGLGGGEASSYDPLRIARAVHQACARDPHNLALQGKSGHAGRELTVATSWSPGEQATRVPLQLPVTLVETSEAEPDEIFEPFSGWLIPVDSQQLGYTWLATACRDPAFAEFFSGIVAFSDANAEVYTVPLPAAWQGQSWRALRRALYGVTAPERGAGAVPLGLYRASLSEQTRRPSAHADLRTRLLINPPHDTMVAAGDLLVGLSEDEAALRQIVRHLRLPA
ncbi:MAG: hypothetical protein IPO88_25750 [Nannocystis sp.]|uniref:TAXI family TRAP transporter solute-binding subunit n=1 Tax=Nannocystis sp. TaxID=1962667 RepID=UPI002421548B|nr:TAXI family TRAP transporter solute-binding subunit [Nannocystis sp.]MBK9756841.1 hypothetical protein [Nannocystis sp.]